MTYACWTKVFVAVDDANIFVVADGANNTFLLLGDGGWRLLLLLYIVLCRDEFASDKIRCLYELFGTSVGNLVTFNVDLFGVEYIFNSSAKVIFSLTLRLNLVIM